MIVGRFNMQISEQLKKIGRGAVIAAVAAALTSILQGAEDLDFGVWTPYVVAAISILVNVCRKLIGL